MAALSDDELRPILSESLERQVMAVAREELERHGQRLTHRIRGGGHDQETGSEFMTNSDGEHYAKFSVAFEGKREGAVAAADAWITRVRTFGAVARISHSSLRGTDGTNAHAFDEETEAMVENMDPDMLAWIDEQTDQAEHRRSGQ